MIFDIAVMFGAIVFMVMVVVALKEVLLVKRKKARDEDETQ